MLTTQKQIQQSFYRAALQAGTARQIAEMKKHRRFKKEKSTKVPYKPGVTKLGTNPAHEKYPESIRVPHVVNPHRRSVRWRNG